MSLQIEVDGLPGHVSFSQLTGWIKCGKAFQLGRILQVPQRPFWASVGGKAFHHAADDVDEAGVWTENTFVDWFAKSVEEEQARNPEYADTETWYASGRKTADHPRGQDGSWWVKEGPPMVYAYSTYRNENPWRIPTLAAELGGDEISGIEVPLDVEIVEGVRIVGFIDRLFVVPSGELNVIDLKTSLREPIGSLQLGIYACGLEKQYGVRPPWGSYYMARPAKMSNPYPLDHYTPALVGELFTQFRRACKAGAFLPNVTNMCVSCQVGHACLLNGGENAGKYDPLAQLAQEATA